MGKNKQFINAADIINPKTGKTFRQENNEKRHLYEVGDLVEINGERYFVTRQTRDCDGTPLYSLEAHGFSEEGMQLICRNPCSEEQ